MTKCCIIIINSLLHIVKIIQNFYNPINSKKGDEYMGNISQQIDKIIASRKEKLSLLQAHKDAMGDVWDRILTFRQFQSDLRANPDDFSGIHGEYEIAEKIMGISTTPFEQLYQSYISDLNLMMKRLSRDRLHISFVGSAGQGKSLVMQNISGLPKSVIPSSDGGDCTGAKSIITNSDSDTVTAQITFYTKGELVGMVNQYLKALSAPTIRYVSDIPSLDLAPIKARVDKSGIARDEELYDYLEKYVKYFDDYSGNLTDNSDVEPLSVPESEIEKYVAQYSSADTSIEYHQYLGVKVANISKRFPHADSGRIVLVDTVGLGTTSLDTEKDMLKAVKEDSDAIIFMQCPNDRRGRISQDEIVAIDSIIKEVGTGYTKEMLFWVLNRVESGNKQPNGKQVALVMQKIKQKNYAIAMSLDVDCFNPQEVEEKLLTPVLTQLSQKMGAVDDLQIKSLNEKAHDLFLAYAQICQATDQAFASSATQDLKRKFHNRIVQTFDKKLLFQLKELYLHEYNDRRNLPCEKLMTASQEKLKHVIQSVLTEEEVIDLLTSGNENQPYAYMHSTDIMRMRIIDDFTQLNDVLDKLVETMKEEVLRIFISPEIGRLGFVYPMEGTSSEWIEGFINKVDAEKNYPVIAASLKKFEAYGINVQGFLIHEVRDKLDPIDVTLVGQPNLNEQLTNLSLVAKQIVEFLKTNIETVHEEIEKALAQLYTIPNRSMFAAVKDLTDRLTYTRADGENAVAYEWQCLYEDWMHLIWKEEYEQENALRSVADRWIQVVTRLKEINNLEYFSIKSIMN